MGIPKFFLGKGLAGLQEFGIDAKIGDRIIYRKGSPTYRILRTFEVEENIVDGIPKEVFVVAECNTLAPRSIPNGPLDSWEYWEFSNKVTTFCCSEECLERSILTFKAGRTARNCVKEHQIEIVDSNRDPSEMYRIAIISKSEIGNFTRKPDFTRTPIRKYTKVYDIKGRCYAKVVSDYGSSEVILQRGFESMRSFSSLGSRYYKANFFDIVVVDERITEQVAKSDSLVEKISIDIKTDAAWYKKTPHQRERRISELVAMIRPENIKTRTEIIDGATHRYEIGEVPVLMDNINGSNLRKKQIETIAKAISRIFKTEAERQELLSTILNKMTSGVHFDEKLSTDSTGKDFDTGGSYNAEDSDNKFDEIIDRISKVVGDPDLIKLLTDDDDSDGSDNPDNQDHQDSQEDQDALQEGDENCNNEEDSALKEMIVKALNDPDFDDFLNFANDVDTDFDEFYNESDEEEDWLWPEVGINVEPASIEEPHKVALSELAHDKNFADMRLLTGQAVRINPTRYKPKSQLLYVLIDDSSSMNGQKIAYAKAVIIKLLKKAKIDGSRVYFRFFTTSPDTLHKVENSADATKKAARVLTRSQIGGGTEIMKAMLTAATDMNEAFKDITNTGDQQSGERLPEPVSSLLIVTDGQSYMAESETKEYDRLSKNIGGIKLFSCFITGSNTDITNTDGVYNENLATKTVIESRFKIIKWLSDTSKKFTVKTV